jgi:O-antigen ligase/Tfp pilus assembly protein PilF
LKLSNKKIKYIHRNASRKTPENIAGELGISARDVRSVLNQREPGSENRMASALERTCHWGLVLVCLVSPFMFLRGIYDFANLPQLAFVEVAAVFLLIVWLIKGLTNQGCVITKSPFNFPILAFILWCLISVVYAHNRYEALLPWMSWAASTLMFFLVLNDTREKGRSTDLLTALFASGCLCALLGIAQHLLGFSGVPQVVPPAATFANKNMATHLVVLTVPLAVGVALTSAGRLRLWVVALASGLMISFLVYTKTRAGWVALAAEGLLLTVLLLRERFQNGNVALFNNRNMLAAGAGLVVVLLMVNLGPDGVKWGFGEILEETATMSEFHGETSDDEGGADRNIELRVAIWRNTVEMIKDRPWTGWGLGNHKLFYPLYHRKVVKEKFFSETSQLSHVHNDFLQAFAELGLVGMVLLVWLFAVLARVVFRLTSRSYPDHVRLWTIAVVTSVAGLFVNACFSFPFQRSIPPVVFMVFLGIIGAFYAGSDGPCRVIRKRWLILCGIVVASTAWIGLIRFHTLSIACDRHFMYMTQLEQAKNWRGVIQEAKKAHAYNPARAKVLSYLGRAYVETGQYKEGIAALEKVIAVYPNHMNALLNIGVAYGNIQDYDKALEVYDKVLEIKPDYGKVHNNMGNIYMKQKNLDIAVQAFELAADLDSENSIIRFNLGTANLQMKRYEEAARAFEKAVELKPEWSLAHKRLGALYLNYLDRRPEGIKHLKKALELNPRMQDADKIRKVIDGAAAQEP